MERRSAGWTSQDVLRVAVVDHEPVVLVGLAALVEARPGMALVGTAGTVAALLATRPAARVVVLGAPSPHGEGVGADVAELCSAGSSVVVFGPSAPWSGVAEAERAGAAAAVERGASGEAVLAVVERVGRAVRPVPHPTGPDLRLTPREREILALYAAGDKADSVARQLGVSRETVLDHVRHIRVKYSDAQRPAPTKVDLYRRAVEDGVLPPPW